MRKEFLVPPLHFGVFGPEILLGARSGNACLRHDNGDLLGELPAPPVSNAYAVWVGQTVLVVSQGVDPNDRQRVAEGVRLLLETSDMEVVFSVGARGELGRQEFGVEQLEASSLPARDLALAEAYALLQRGLVETDELAIRLGSQRFAFRVDFKPSSLGRYVPHLS